MALLAGPLRQSVDDDPRGVGEHQKDGRPPQPGRQRRPRLEHSENLAALQTYQGHGRPESRALFEVLDAGHLSPRVEKGESPLASIVDEEDAIRPDPDPLDEGVFSRAFPLPTGARANTSVRIEKDDLPRLAIGDDQRRIRKEDRARYAGEFNVRRRGVDEARLDRRKVQSVHVGEADDLHARRVDGGEGGRGFLVRLTASRSGDGQDRPDETRDASAHEGGAGRLTRAFHFIFDTDSAAQLAPFEPIQDLPLFRIQLFAHGGRLLPCALRGAHERDEIKIPFAPQRRSRGNVFAADASLVTRDGIIRQARASSHPPRIAAWVWLLRYRLQCIG